MRKISKRALGFGLLATNLLTVLPIASQAQTLAESGLPISEQYLNKRVLSRSASIRSDPFAEKSGSAYTQSGPGSNLPDQYLYEIPSLGGTSIQATLPKVGPQYPQSSSTLGWYSSSIMVAEIGVPLPPIG